METRREAKIQNSTSLGEDALPVESGMGVPARVAERPRAVENWLVAAVMIASAVAAWVHIRSTTIWYDEALSLLISSGHGTLDWGLGMHQFKPTTNLVKILSELYRYDVHPPLYFWTLAIWRSMFGESLEVARWLSAVFTLATLGLLYRYAIAIGMRWASAPVIIYAASSAGLRYAYNARPYAMATFLIVLTLFLAQRRSRWVGICAAACVGTHYFAALCVGPILVVEWMMGWKTERRWVLWTAFSFALFCLPLALLVTKHMGARPNQYPGFGTFRKEIATLLFAALRAGMPGTTIGPEWRFALFLGGLFAIAGAIWALRRRLFTVPLAYAGFLCGFLLLSFVTHKTITKMPSDYYLGIGVPLSALLMGYFASAVPLASPLLGLALLIGTVTTTPMMMPPGNYRAMSDHIRLECDHCALLAGGPAVPACVLYEAKGLDVFVLGVRDTPDSVVERIGRGRTIYLFPSDDASLGQIEAGLVQSFPSVAGDGYFKIDTTYPKPDDSIRGK